LLEGENFLFDRAFEVSLEFWEGEFFLKWCCFFSRDKPEKCFSVDFFCGVVVLDQPFKEHVWVEGEKALADGAVEESSLFDDLFVSFDEGVA